MNRNRMKFVFMFLVVATLLLSAFAVAQQATRRPPASRDLTKIQRDSLKSSSIKLQEGPLAQPKPVKQSRPTGAETHGVILPDFKPAAKTRNKAGEKSIIDPLFKPTEKNSAVNPNFKRATHATGWIVGAVGLESSMKNRARYAQMPTKKVEQKSVNEKGLIDPSFKPTESKGMIDPNFHPENK